MQFIIRYSLVFLLILVLAFLTIVVGNTTHSFKTGGADTGPNILSDLISPDDPALVLSRSWEKFEGRAATIPDRGEPVELPYIIPVKEIAGPEKYLTFKTQLRWQGNNTAYAFTGTEGRRFMQIYICPPDQTPGQPANDCYNPVEGASYSRGYSSQLVIIPDLGGGVDMFIQTTNRIGGRTGVRRPPLIGTYQQLQSRVAQQSIVISLLVGSFTLAALISIILGMRIKRGHALILFGALTLVMSVRIMVNDAPVGLVLPELDSFSRLRIEYLTYYWLGPLFFGLVVQLFPIERMNYLRPFLYGLATAASFLTFTLDGLSLAYLLDFYHNITAVATLAALIVLTIACYKHRFQAWLATAAFTLILAGFINDSLYLAGKLPWSMELGNWGYGLFVMMQLVVFLRRNDMLEDAILRQARLRRHVYARLRRQSAALREAMNEAEQATRSKSAFLANMSHETRTPLNAIIGFAEMIECGMADKIGHTQEYAKDIMNSGNHLLSIINDILDISRIESSEQELDESTFDLDDMLQQTIRLVQPIAAKKEITLEYTADENRRIMLLADRRILIQALTNLLSNAIKFSPAGKRVRLLIMLRKNGTLAITIKDNGIGMSEKEMDLALQPFGRVSSPYNANIEGTGLGLPLVKTFIEIHGGKLTLSSKPDKGTNATISLPGERIQILQESDPEEETPISAVI